MTALRHIFELRVVVESPFIFPGAEMHSVGVDATALRDDDGHAILPTDHLKGLLLEAARTCAPNDPPTPLIDERTRNDWFGTEKGNDANDQSWEPDRGRLLFADLAAEKDGAWDNQPSSRRLHTRIQIDDERGAVEEGMLQTIELAAPFGRLITFAGKMLFHGEEVEARQVEKSLTKALRLIPFFGGLRSIGFGRHRAEQSSIAHLNSEPLIAPSLRQAPAARLVFEATFDRPFLIAATALANNIFVGGTVLPGGAIKGALADMLARAGLQPDARKAAAVPELSQVLGRLHVSHAFPVENGARLDRSLPLSIKTLGGEAFQDAGVDGDEARGLIGGMCADFQPDWKSKDFAAFGKTTGRNVTLGRLSHRQRTHTVIDRATGTAKDENLFVEVARGPQLDKQPLRLRFRVEFAAGDERTEAAKDIAAILAGPIDAIGKTRAVMRLKPVDDRPDPPVADLGPWRVVLETPAALLDLDSPLAPRDGDRPVSARAQLAAYVSEVVKGAELNDCFLQLRRAGGYHARRGSRPYRPTLIFEPGSTLLLRRVAGASDDPAQALRIYLKAGLPVMRWTSATTMAKETDWTANAYLPQNGYGEISVDDEVFAKLAKGAGS